VWGNVISLFAGVVENRVKLKRYECSALVYSLIDKIELPNRLYTHNEIIQPLNIILNWRGLVNFEGTLRKSF